MKKTIFYLFILMAFASCEQLGISSPESNLIGSWKHTASGAKAGGDGSVTYKGTTYKLARETNNPSYNLTFKKNGVCDCLGYDKYTVSAGTLTFTNSSTNKTYQYDYSIVKDGLALFEVISQWKKEDSAYSSIDYVHNFDKQ